MLTLFSFCSIERKEETCCLYFHCKRRKETGKSFVSAMFVCLSVLAF